MTRHAVSTRVHKERRCEYRTKDGDITPWACDRCDTVLTSRDPHELHLAVNAHINNEARAKA